MLTENLQEMVSGINDNSGKGMISEYDILLGHTTKKEKLAVIAKDEEESSPGQELQVMEGSSADIQPQQNDQPVTEATMINYINDLNIKLGEVTIVTHWQIGQTINSFYQGKYGTNELGRISEATGIGRDTLAKACKFAKQYSKQDVEMLLKGNFVMSWYQIAQHLTVEPQKVIETYHQSPDQKQFYYDIIKLKAPSEVRGKSKPPKILEVMDTDATVIMPVESIAAECPEPVKAMKPDIQAKSEAGHEKEINMLKLENDRLKKEILFRDAKVIELQKTLVDIQREKDRSEDLYYEYMDKLDKVRAGLESGTPVRAMIEWIENGAED